MKKMFTTILAAVILVVGGAKSDAQQTMSAQEIRQLHTDVMHKMGQSLTPFSLTQRLQDDSYVMTHIEHSYYMDDDWASQRQTEISHDETGMTEVLFLQMEGDEMVSDSRHVFVRDADGFEMTVEVYDRVNQEFVPEERLTWTMDDHETVPSEILFETRIGGDWEYEWRETVTFTDGRVDVVLNETWTGSDWENQELISIIEDETDIVQRHERWINEEWVNYEQTIFHDFSYDQLHAFFVDNFEQEEIGFMMEDLFRFFSGLPEITFEAWDDEVDEWLPIERFRRDVVAGDNGEQDALFMEEWVDGDWMTDLRLLIIETGTGQWDMIQAQIPEADLWITVMEEDYHYDERELLVTVIRSMASETGDLENSERYDFEWMEDPSTTDAEEIPDSPVSHKLHAAWPNPFNPTTVVPFELGEPGYVAIEVYDITGRKITTLFEGNQPAGRHQITLDASGFASGVYLIRMVTDNIAATQRVTLVK